MLDVVRRALSGLGLLAACAPGMANADYVFQRIDYQVVSPALQAAVRGATIYKRQRFSDHAPPTIDYDCEF